LPHAGGQLAFVGAVSVAGSLLAVLAAVYARMVGRLGLKNLVEYFIHEQISAPIAEQDLFEFPDLDR
jgi:glycine cleavage system pyridoxal-binding protein P